MRPPPLPSRRAAALCSLLTALLLLGASVPTAASTSTRPAPRRALLESSFFKDVTIRITCNGGGLQPLTGGSLDATAEAFRASLGWMNEQRGADAFTVRSARLVRPPIAGPGTATIAVHMAARADAVDELVRLAVEKVDNQIIAGAMRERGVEGLWKADLVDASTRPLGARRSDAAIVATGTVWQGYGPDANAPANVVGSGGGGGGDDGGGEGNEGGGGGAAPPPPPPSAPAAPAPAETAAAATPPPTESTPTTTTPPPPPPTTTPPPPPPTTTPPPPPPPTTTPAPPATNPAATPPPPTTPPPTVAPPPPPPTPVPTPPRVIDLNLNVAQEVAPPGSAGGSASEATAAVREAVAAQLGVPVSDVSVSYYEGDPASTGPQLVGGRRRLRQVVAVDVSTADTAAAAAPPPPTPTTSTTFRIRVSPQTSKAAVSALKAARTAAADPDTAAAWRDALAKAGLAGAAGVGVTEVAATGLTAAEDRAAAAQRAASASSSRSLSKGAIAGIVVGCLAGLALAAALLARLCRGGARGGGGGAHKGALSGEGAAGAASSADALAPPRRSIAKVLSLDRKASGILPPPADGLPPPASPGGAVRQPLSYDSVLAEAAREAATPTRPGGRAGAAGPGAVPPSPPEVVALRAEHARLVAETDAQAAVAAAEAARQAKAEARAAAAAVQAADLRAALTAADSRVAGSSPGSKAAAQAASHAAARALAAEADAETAAREAELASAIAASAAGEARLLASERDAAARDLAKARNAATMAGRTVAAAAAAAASSSAASAGAVRGLRSHPTSPDAAGSGPVPSFGEEL